jgi:hypothetical protein
MGVDQHGVFDSVVVCYSKRVVECGVALTSFGNMHSEGTGIILLDSLQLDSSCLSCYQPDMDIHVYW